MMRLCLTICGAVLAGCGPEPVKLPPELVAPCPGWQGPTPKTEGELIRAALAEKGGRECANSKLATIAAMQ